MGSEMCIRDSSLIHHFHNEREDEEGEGGIAMPSDTIFAFLTLNTPRSAHKEISGAKFLSFECAAIMY